MVSFVGQNLFCPSNRLFDMCTSKHQKPSAARMAIRLAEIHESGENSNLPSLKQQQPLWAAMGAGLINRIEAWFLERTRHQSNYLQSSVVLDNVPFCQFLQHSIAMNTARSLQSPSFSQLTVEEKLEVKLLGPDRPQLLTKSGWSSRWFTETWYSKHSCLTGCIHSGKVYCFPCLLLGDSQQEKAVAQSGINDWKHLSEKVKHHFKCSCHV